MNIVSDRAGLEIESNRVEICAPYSERNSGEKAGVSKVNFLLVPIFLKLTLGKCYQRINDL
jgi:hypothetical protein